MDQSSKHDTPSALQAILTTRPGHDLELGINYFQVAKVLTSRRLRTSLIHTADEMVDPIR